MSRKSMAEYLGVSLRTIRYWEAGRSRVPWSTVRLLRLKRLGDLGALEPAWAGFVLNRNGLCTPDGRVFTQAGLHAWWSTAEQARFWRADYDRRTLRGVGRSPAITLLPEADMAAEQAAAAPPQPIEAVSTLTALARRRVSRQAPPAGMAVSLSPVPVRHGRAAAARSDAGLVNLSTSGTRYPLSRIQQELRRVHGR